MKSPSLVFVAVLATISAANASKLHRMPFEKVRRSADGENTSQQKEATIARYTRPRPISRVQRPQKGIFHLTSRRPESIDATRVPIKNTLNDVVFMGVVGIGTPPQYFNLEFDIGSADTWVTGTHANCSQNTPCPPERNLFSPNHSTTFELSPNIPWHASFSDGASILGTLHTDVLQIGDFVVDHQVMGVAKSLSSNLHKNIDGSFGLGLKDLSFNGDPTPVESLIQSGSIKSEIGVWMGTGHQGGELTFGGRDPARFKGELEYFSVPQGSAYWSTPVRSITVITQEVVTNKTEAPIHPKKISHQIDSRVGSGTGVSVPSAIFDTSTDIILLPPRVAHKVHQYIHNFFFGLYTGYSYLSNSYTVPCNLDNVEIWVELGPSVERSGSTTSNITGASYATFERANTTGSGYGNNKFLIRGRDLVREHVPVVGGLFGVCFSGIQASKTDEDDWVFGNIWFMNNYMTLNHAHRQIGIAPAVQMDNLD